MATFPLFETTESVIEVLWDIALAIFITRLAFIYFLVTSASVGLLAFLASKDYLPYLSELTATPHSSLLALSAATVLLSVVWARFVVTYFEVPRVLSFRLAIGGVALFFAAAAASLAGCVIYGKGQGAWASAEAGGPAGAAWGATGVAFAVMPVLSMLTEARQPAAGGYQSTSHGHENKSIVAAVPTVNLTEKKAAKEKKSN
ncbi:hypothetical protein NKR23_g61 [Pleurostoma richardsiae]|uniref:Uncharacterized protein n=1 Tax=Pleurostoma richardsiae TaxID=41990 RepID=A0AA38S233_9PEZI|nr:hypothetical protein NKR23_g61 [Pleurostoma richardsiae]